MNIAKVYFLNPPFIDNFVRCGRWQGVRARGKTLYYPLWLCYAAGFSESKGEDVRVVDAIASKMDHEAVMRDIESFEPEIIVVDSNFSSFVHDARFAVMAKMKLRQKPTTVVVGPPTAVYSHRIVGNLEVDIAARREFDHTILEISEVLSGKRSIASVPGITYREDGDVIDNPDRQFLTSEELDKLPFVSQVFKKHLNIGNYWLDHTLHPMVQIITSRGCPHLCTFCSWTQNFTGRRFRARSVDNLIAEIEWILQNLPQVREIFFEDDTFTTDVKRVHEFTSEMLRRRLKITWSCQSRANLDYSTLKSMREAGCRLVDVGFESGSEDILRNIKKGIRKERMVGFAKDVKHAELLLLGDFVLGFPGESVETINQTKNLIKKIRPHLLQVAVATPIPGTEFYDWAKETGALTEDDPSRSIDDRGFQRCIISYSNLGPESLETHVKKILLSYYLSPSTVPVLLSSIFRENGVLELKRVMNSVRYFLEYARS